MCNWEAITLSYFLKTIVENNFLSKQYLHSPLPPAPSEPNDSGVITTITTKPHTNSLFFCFNSEIPFPTAKGF